MSDQSIVFLLISATLFLFIWGRIRYDLVAGSVGAELGHHLDFGRIVGDSAEGRKHT